MLGDIPANWIFLACGKSRRRQVQAFVAELREKERKATETRAEISRLKGLLTQTMLLNSIKYPLEFFTTGTDMIGGAVYTIPKLSVTGFVSKLGSELGDFVEYQKLPENEKDTVSTFAVLFRKSDLEKIQSISSEFSAGRIDVPKDFELTAEEERVKLTSEIEKAEKEEAVLSAEIASKADEGLDMARYYGDYWNILSDRIGSMISGVPTDDVFIWSFWMPRDCRNMVENTVRPYESLSEFSLIEPDQGSCPRRCSKIRDGHLLWNRSPLCTVAPTMGELIRHLDGPFFLFLMCFGDAGYGLVLSGVFGLYSKTPALAYAA